MYEVRCSKHISLCPTSAGCLPIVLSRHAWVWPHLCTAYHTGFVLLFPNSTML